MGYHSPAFTLATYVHLFPSDLPCGDLLEGDNEVATRPTETSRNGEARDGLQTCMESRPSSVALTS